MLWGKMSSSIKEFKIDTYLRAALEAEEMSASLILSSCMKDGIVWSYGVLQT